METTDIIVEGDTLATLFYNAVQLRKDKVMMREKDFGIWKAISWEKAYDRSKDIGLGLMSLGFAVGDTASILSNNNPEWIISDLAIHGAGGVSAGIYPTDAESQVEYLINDSGSSFIFVEDEEQLDKALTVRDKTPNLKKIIVFDMEGLRDFKDPQVLSLDELSALGRAYGESHADEWETRRTARKANEMAILVYTSGTTGPPKGAMISHRNVIFQAQNGTRYFGMSEGEEWLSFLPLCHVAERSTGFYSMLYAGGIINFAESPETVPENIREVAPTIFLGVPRVWEKFYSVVIMAIKDATWLQQKIYQLAIGVGHLIVDYKLARKPVPFYLKAAFWVGYQLALKNIRKMVGIDRCKITITGAAPISPDLIRWYLAMGMTMIEAYGQTENGGACTLMPLDAIKLGTVGKPVDWGEVKISEQGEILLRGEHIFLGYFNNKEKTEEALDGDGWLHTGDVGLIDEEGYVKVTDRMKDIIITAGGKNITPSEIENQLKFSPYITDAVVIGDQKKYLTCLIMIDADNVAKFAQDHDIPFTDYASMCRATEVVGLINDEVEKVNKNFAQVETIKKFHLIDKLLTPEDDELTPTMKLKRKFVHKKYEKQIDAMY